MLAKIEFLNGEIWQAEIEKYTSYSGHIYMILSKNNSPITFSGDDVSKLYLDNELFYTKEKSKDFQSTKDDLSGNVTDQETIKFHVRLELKNDKIWQEEADHFDYKRGKWYFFSADKTIAEFNETDVKRIFLNDVPMYSSSNTQLADLLNTF